jgi:hypothetical protein
MPSVSKAQNAAMWAAREGKSSLGIPASVGRDFNDAQTPGSVKKLPQRVATPKGTKSMKAPLPRKPFGSFAP